MRILYYVMTHANAPQVRRLVRRLRDDPDGVVLVHHDARSREPLGLEPSAGVRLIGDPVAVRWAHISMVRAMMRGIEWARERHLPFDWMLFLSGQDYPIRPLREVRRELAATPLDAFVRHREIRDAPGVRRTGYEEVCVRRYMRRRIRVPGGYLFLRRRHPYRDGLRCYAGSQWLNLSRRAVEAVWEREDLARRLLDHLRAAICPDETFFHTLLLADPALRVGNDDRRFLVWDDHANHPAELCLEHLPAIEASDAWFARKVDGRRCPELLDRLDARLGEDADGARSAAAPAPPAPTAP